MRGKARSNSHSLGVTSLGKYAMVSNSSDVPALFAMAAFFFGFGLLAILRPAAIRNAMDSCADTWKQGSWHPYKISLPLLRVIVGGAGMLGAALFLYIAVTILKR